MANCCGGTPIDLNKFGNCRMCFFISLLAGLSCWLLLFLFKHYFFYPVLLALSILFSLTFILHVLGYIMRKS